jgi:hypothetical protein
MIFSVSLIEHIALLYTIGCVWSLLSWSRTVHEHLASAELSSGRRSEKNRENALRQVARESFREGKWSILLWPLVVVRNLRSVMLVAKDCWARPKG